MKSLSWYYLVIAFALSNACLSLAGETGMSYDGDNDPNGPKPQFAPPGAGTNPKPQIQNTTPVTPQLGITPQQGGVPRKPEQPGSETPQAGLDAGKTVKPHRLSNPRASGDEDDIDDLEIERHTVRGVDMPGPPAKGPSQGSTTAQPTGGDGTQTEDDLYVGRKATDSPLTDVKQDPKSALPSSSPSLPTNNIPLTTQPSLPASGQVFTIPRENCGTHWTGYVDDPKVDVNPCPTNCVRGERQTVNTRKEGSKLKYSARYQCYLPELTVSKQIPGVSPQTAGGKPRQNCGTFWTGWQNNLNTNVNPCPKGCEPGELQLVNRHSAGNILQYNKRYLCYKNKQEHSAVTTPQSGTKLAMSHPGQEPEGGIKEIPREAFHPKVMTTDPIQILGTRRPPFASKSITTAAIQIAGTRRPLFVPKLITTGSMKITGTRIRLPAFKTDRQIIMPPSLSQPIMPR